MPQKIEDMEVMQQSYSVYELITLQAWFDMSLMII